MIGKRENILLMTATITLCDSPKLARTDATLRFHDCRDALGFYLTPLGATLDGIVFVENSDSDVSSLHALVERHGANDRVELIANYGMHGYPGYDRSCGEYKILNLAMAAAALIARAGKGATVWKVTGRYMVRNLRRMLATPPRTFDLYCAQEQTYRLGRPALRRLDKAGLRRAAARHRRYVGRGSARAGDVSLLDAPAGRERRANSAPLPIRSDPNVEGVLR